MVSTFQVSISSHAKLSLGSLSHSVLNVLYTGENYRVGGQSACSTYHFQLVTDKAGSVLKRVHQVLLGFAGGSAGLKCNAYQFVQWCRDVDNQLVDMGRDQVHLVVRVSGCGEGECDRRESSTDALGRGTGEIDCGYQYSQGMCIRKAHRWKCVLLIMCGPVQTCAYIHTHNHN